MIFKQTIIAGIFMLLLSIPIKGEIIISTSDNVISASSTSIGSEGFHGCDAINAKKVSAYIFELQSQKINNASSKARNASTCSSGQRWTTIAKKETNTGKVDFENIPDGNYRVIVLTGQAIGCTITGATGTLPSKSIIYQKEASPIIKLGQNVNEKSNLNLINNTTLNVFPNPVNNEINIELQSNEMQEEATITLVDLLGQTIFSTQQPLDKTTNIYTWKINVQNFPSGAYFLNLMDKKGKQLSQKIIIQHNQ